jgi:GNAT superfamily N-acetyltransferase
MQSVARIDPAKRADVVIRTGSLWDVDVLVEIDNDASMLFEQAGLRLDSSRERELELAERRRWSQCLCARTVLLAVQAGRDVGFAALGLRDGEPYLDQLSVRVSAMQQGIGTQLLHGAIRMAQQARGRALWLTTYSHLSWNRPYYERNGFAVVTAEECGEELRGELLFERGILPCPQERVVMRRELATAVF